ncbi:MULTISPECIES: fructose-bisphosphate aldolase [unclassified Pseudonocardia]|jgi:class I fructose-bisphosphate aldolase|uniref:class I fructose-bisphosphate aldolase n=1 Tax=unclassified Pseudonocardia TaxID=2619320 RepID=UPI0009627522|nr:MULTISPECIES: fructose-bisphosphate aldolase [unclassified Pseudonocardia]MBN9096765.1 fructose-bisphosphate aldolase [Pseudonocardia sp.]OJY51778.1 MAG: fructose-bisphosphate aldolase [Pseudonocardia sp. 73-21]
MVTRPGLDSIGLGAGKKARLHRILHEHGLRNGTALFLPYDQGLEHGPRDFTANPVAGDPRYIIRLAVDGGFNGIVVQIGLAEKFAGEFAGEVPLVLKLNGKTEIPSDAEALSPLHASVEDAVRLGADAVGYTLYVGSPAQAADFAQYRQVRADAQRLGMPLIVWAYPRGAAVVAKGGTDSFYAVDYAARVASELGADVVKVNFPHPEKRTGVPAAYDVDVTSQDAIDRVVRSANHTLLLVSGGSRAGDDAMLEKARESMDAGATGLIWGRNVWQRGRDESLRFVERIREILAKYPTGPGS